MTMKRSIGLYIHIPFCRQKCNYCDFYSLTNASLAMEYARRVAQELERLSLRYPRKANTMYLGGGTPTMMPPEGLELILCAARKWFELDATAEITCEVNPGDGYPTKVDDLKALGINRLSVGLQSAVPKELAALGRTHTPQDVACLLQRAQQLGLTNCTVDLMWGIPEQTLESALKSVAFACGLQPTHISAYLLKIEPQTKFGKTPPVLPEEDTVCDIYERCCEELERAGFPRYEISNFARPGMKSRHNLKYWNCDETLGIGSASHSFVEGKRFYYPRNLQRFLCGELPIDDGPGGDFTEYAMLQLRLTDGLQASECEKRFGHAIPQQLLQKAGVLIAHGLMVYDGFSLRLTTKGNLVSNEILATIL